MSERRSYVGSMRPCEIDQDQRPTFALGVVVAVITTPLWFFIAAWTNLTRELFLFEQAVLSGAVTLLGGLLTIPWHSRRFGVGLAVGASLAWLLEMMILGILLMTAFY